MKNILIISISLFLAISLGINIYLYKEYKMTINNCDKTNSFTINLSDEEKQIVNDKKTKLTETMGLYVINIQNNFHFKNETIVNNQIIVTLNDLKNNYNIDVSDFINPITNQDCDGEKTAITYEIDSNRKVTSSSFVLSCGM